MHDLQPVIIYCDNQSAIHIVSNPIYYKHTKHIELDCHFVYEKIQSSVLKLLAICSSHLVADILTNCNDCQLVS